jgi:glycerol-3-phosphate cytidylyltransferase
MEDRIKVVKKLYEQGHTIKIYTARGCVSGLTSKLIKHTENQLNKFGIKHHELVMGQKPHFDLLIDDKAQNADVWFEKELFKTRKIRGVIAGNFDIIHPGYIKMFKDAKSVCQYVIVFLQQDPSVERSEKLKPIVPLSERIDTLLSLRYVDQVTTYTTESNLLSLLKTYTPHIRILGSDYIDKKYTGDNLKNEVYYHTRDHDWSTTSFKRKIVDSLKDKK